MCGGGGGGGESSKDLLKQGRIFAALRLGEGIPLNILTKMFA